MSYEAGVARSAEYPLQLDAGLLAIAFLPPTTLLGMPLPTVPTIPPLPPLVP